MGEGRVKNTTLFSKFVSSLGFRSLAPCDCMGQIGTEDGSLKAIGGPTPGKAAGEQTQVMEAIDGFLGIMHERGTCFCRQDYNVICYEPKQTLTHIEHLVFDPVTGFNSTITIPTNVTSHAMTEEYALVWTAAWFAVIVYAFLIPLFYYRLLKSCRHDLIVGPPSRLSIALKFLHDEYTPHFYLWELVEIFRKVGFPPYLLPPLFQPPVS